MIFDRALTAEEIGVLYNGGSGTETIPDDSYYAAYVSNGWSLDVIGDFGIEIDFHYSAISDRDGWVGMNIEKANDVNNYVSISAGSDGNQPYFYYEKVVDGNAVFGQQLRASDDGTLYISYDVGVDELYLSSTGYGVASAWQTISGLLQGQWTSPVDVVIGGGSDRVVLSPGDAYLDNFETTTGTLLGWPLPPCIVPNVVGETEANAVTAITDAGFAVGTVSYVNGGGVPLGDVVSQSEAPGTEPGCGTAVDIGVSAKCADPNAPFYAEWQAWGEPNCWCYERNCRGDADGIISGPYWVAIPDLNIMRSAINKIDSLLAGIPNGICADFDHIKSGPYRVAISDLNILRSYINKLAVAVPSCPKDWDIDSDDDYNFWCVPGGVCP
jgi:hypothetical protein